ncbi:MAG: class I SAM-dependent methyltransferase [Ignavibacteriales bacterium]
MTYDAKENWNKEFMNTEMAWPAEYVIRIFKGEYPNLHLKKNGFENKKICDVGCGDGRNLVVLNQCGFDLYGIEITDFIVDKTKNNLDKAGVEKVDLRVGSNDTIPYEDNFFDYLLSWNSCYYMGDKEDFSEYVKEYARVLKKDGYLVLSIPKKTCFIFKGSDVKRPGYNIIREDPLNIRNGEILRIFEDENEIEEAFGSHFKNFIFGDTHDNCFGYNYHWHLVVCQKK